MNSSNRILFIVLKALALLAVLLAAVWVYFDVSYGRQLDRELAKLRAEGAPLSLAEAAPKAPPPDQNAATLYMPIFQVNFDPKKPVYPEDAKGLKRFDLTDTNTGDWASAESLRPVLEGPECQRALGILREASLRRLCVFPVPWQAASGLLSPAATQFRQATRLCSAEAVLEAKAGNMAGAVDWLGVCYRMADHASQEPTLIAQLVGIAVLTITDKAAQAVLNAGDVTPGTAATLCADLNRLQIASRFTQGIENERANGLDIFRLIRSGEFSLADISKSARDRTPPPRSYALSCLMRPYWELEELNYLEWMDQFAGRASLPYRVTAGTADRDKSRYRRPGSIVTAMLAPVLSKASGKRDQALAQLDLLRTGLALKLIKRTAGGYPATLDALGPNRTKDIFTGRDFIYQRVGHGFKLYSVRMNLRDDHGVGYQTRTPAVTEGSRTDDIVWECPG
ncbi:MAG: hypothetical protein ACYC63_16960 [Armatimonadota bacterium]